MFVTEEYEWHSHLNWATGSTGIGLVIFESHTLIHCESLSSLQAWSTRLRELIDIEQAAEHGDDDGGDGNADDEL